MNCAFQLTQFPVSSYDISNLVKRIQICLEQTQKTSSQELLQGMKHGSIIMIQRPNKSPCNGNTRGPLLPRNVVCNNQLERSWQQFSGTQKVFCFWNSCHTRQPLLETPMLPQWWLYARISNRNIVESCRLLLCCFMTMHPHTRHGLLQGNVAS